MKLSSFILFVYVILFHVDHLNNVDAYRFSMRVSAFFFKNDGSKWGRMEAVKLHVKNACKTARLFLVLWSGVSFLPTVTDNNHRADNKRQ